MKSSTECNCENQKPEKVTKVIKIGGQSVLVEDAPARICRDCGEIYFEGRFLLDLEKQLLETREKQAA